MMRRLLIFWIIASGAFASNAEASPPQGRTQGARCDSVADTLLPVNQSFEGLQGQYDFVLIKRDSVRTPAGALTGKLYLWKALPSDSNSKGQRPYHGDDTNYFGTTDVNLAAADADFSGFWHDVHSPRRSDVDPIHPRIRGFTIRNPVKGTPPWVIFWLAVGTLMNDRDREGGLDGVGVVFDVKRIDRRGFFGTWDHAGIALTGRGYFCAYRKGQS